MPSIRRMGRAYDAGKARKTRRQASRSRDGAGRVAKALHRCI